MKQQIILHREKFFHRFSKKVNPVKLPIDIKLSDRLLICLPEKNKNTRPILYLIEEYQKLLPKYQIQFCAESSLAPHIPLNVNCIYYNHTSLSFVKKISKTLQETLLAVSYRMTIDLNLDFSLSAAMICKMSGAPIRVSFMKPNADLFFNILINADFHNQSSDKAMPLLKNQLPSLINL